MKSVISIGNQDFISIRKNNCFYIDKTDFIREWWDNQDSVTLITRPRRFGKTLNMSMVEYFFSVNHSECSKYFEDLVIWKEERFRKLQGTYPVISLSFADIKATTYETARRAVIRKLVKLYSTFEFVKSSKVLNEKDRAYFDSVEENMSDDAAAVAVNYLSDYLSRYYGKKVIILLDEYDTPLQESYIHGYWENLTAFIRSLFNSTFKTNPYMERGLLTGITRVSKESIFSDLNNLEVVTTTSEKYSGSFGFTEEEVFHALEENGLSDEKGTVRYWYDGFSFGKRKDIYNPWSITKYLDTGEYGTYWADTSGNMLISNLIRRSGISSAPTSSSVPSPPLQTTRSTCGASSFVFSKPSPTACVGWTMTSYPPFTKTSIISNSLLLICAFPENGLKINNIFFLLSMQMLSFVSHFSCSVFCIVPYSKSRCNPVHCHNFAIVSYKI